MGFIYKITNIINDKVYIGLTKCINPKQRFYKHLAEYRFATKFSKRPLYEAMQKHGPENFKFEVIEETANDNLSNQEKYWIAYYHSYIGFADSRGYNATMGGDGGHKLLTAEERQKIIDLFNAGYGVNYIMANCKHSYTTVNKCLVDNNLVAKKVEIKAILQLDANTHEVIAEHESLCAANIAMNRPQTAGKISEVCRGKRKSAYGYLWQYK